MAQVQWIKSYLDGFAKAHMGNGFNKMHRTSFAIGFLLAGLFATNESSAFSQVTNFSHIKTGVVNYASNFSTYLPLNIKDQVLDWQAHHFDIFLGGADVTIYNPNVIWTAYKDHSYVYPTETYSMRQFAEDKGYDFENVFLHMKTDYQVSSANAWTKMDKFDAFEGTHGVLTVVGSVYADKTDAAYNATPNDVPITEALLLGYGEPFAEATFAFGTFAVGIGVVWQYWNGSIWDSLAVHDGTNGFTANGKVSFLPPSDWARKVENGSQSKWWIRAVVSGGVTKPIASQITGDNWLSTNGIFNSRGWDGNDLNLVNKGLGELEYNPTPPTNATAKFRYQARATGMWASTAMFCNPSAVQNGTRLWAAYLADFAIKVGQTRNFSGIMFDDAEASPQISSPSNAVSSYSDFADYPHGTFAQERMAQLQAEVAIIHNALPHFKVGSNTLMQSMLYAGDWALHESFTQVCNLSGTKFAMSATPDALYSASFDGLLPVNNLKNGAGIIMMMDTYANGKTDPLGNWSYWDRGNRGPMSALAVYYIGANNNTYFSYNSQGTSYFETDDFIYYDTHTTIITQNLAVDISDATKNIYGADFSSFPSSGTLPLRIGDGETTVDIVASFTKIGKNQLQTTGPIRFSHSAGERVRFSLRGHQAVDAIPPVERVLRWANTFPAVFVDVGIPDGSGYNNGNPDFAWKTGAQIGGGQNGVWRRDYTKAVIVQRPDAWNTTKREFDTYSFPIDLGGTFYPLYADGTTGAAITSIALRTGEGAILMKAPVVARISSSSSESTSDILLLKCSPNPVHSGAIISYQLSSVNSQSAHGGPVKLVVYDAKGKVTKILVNKTQPAGKYAAIWNTAGLPSGLYFCKLQVKEKALIEKYLLLK